MRATRLLEQTSLHALAKAVSTDATTLSRCERRLIHPSAKVADALERHYGASIAHLMANADLPLRHNPT
jgi:ribosome-binding protein aMBF1 (putative translation factor)